MNDLRWIGSENTFVDDISIESIGPITVGRFGGCSRSGQSKNEDGCLIWIGQDWEWTMLLDAHDTAESASLVVDQFTKHRIVIEQILGEEPATMFFSLERLVLDLLQEESFRTACHDVQGETACLFLVRKGKYVWWLSVGDVVAYLFHPDLRKHRQFKLNERQFFEWIGRVNTFDLPVPCYTRGIRELRRGGNRILLTTDGLIECPGTPFQDSAKVEVVFERPETAVESLLTTIEQHGVRDSTTLLTWEVVIDETVTEPGNAK
ncbi:MULTISPECIES: protein phosphatase 2C domain-containing protein [Exiguobacterium]|uniref:Protein phosphatase 2C domain-containing protein n=1 Tax=Exiguobacterium antarcticum TaxID=132920 RepID=A0ABT6R3D2_9BACL|nr:MULTISPECIES: protein phosphatase 2C domain-containing protein [Exiguobacterium]AFS70612.1 Protein phosphatase 2C-like protein [Exiguobacterium antarcticum B7]MCT4779991.1 protein phosphatase 2C domain-containing protein [Exiguobacterium soli]MDI3235457.1 protein phosphatase 2C domain-containing protein [Exiguobacterium antarcticum]